MQANTSFIFDGYHLDTSDPIDGFHYPSSQPTVTKINDSFSVSKLAGIPLLDANNRQAIQKIQYGAI